MIRVGETVEVRQRVEGSDTTLGTVKAGAVFTLPESKHLLLPRDMDVIWFRPKLT